MSRAGRVTVAAFMVVVVVGCTLALGRPAAADYVDPSGNTVHWAGGDEIVVTDPDGNVVWQGTGERVEGRLVPPADASNTRSGQPIVDDPASYSDYVLSTDDLVLGLGSASWQASPGGGLASGSSGPYPDTHYAGMQPVTVIIGGATYTGYANVWCTVPDQQGNVYGYSAVPAGSDLGELLLGQGFGSNGDFVLVHNGAGGYDVSWQADPTVEASYGNVSPQQSGWAGGGRIVIRKVTSGGGHSPDAVEFVLPPPDARWFRAGFEAPVAVAGSVLPVWAEAGGQVIDLYVRSAWGYQGPLQPVSAQRWEGGLPVPTGVAPGVYWVEVGALLGQQYYQPRWFPVTGVVVVVKHASPATEAYQGQRETSAEDFDEWWMPLQYSPTWKVDR